MHWEKLPAPEQPCPRPYQGVRVKDPVKELLQRKRRASLSNCKTPTTAVVVPNTVLSSYPQVGASGVFEMGGGVSDVPAVENGAFCTGWIAQAAPAAFQPLAQWPCQEPLTHDPSGPAHTTDMYVQPMCPSYTVVGPSSMLTYTHTPIFANFGARTATSTSLPQVDLPADTSVTYIPWTQPLATVSPPGVQCAPGTAPFSGPQLVSLPVPLPFPEPDPLQLEQARATVAHLPLERLLEEDDDGDTILHIYAAKEMREHVRAVAERLRRLHSVCKIDAREHRGKTPLLVAVTTNQPHIACDLIRLGADVNAADNRGQTALHIAAKYGYPEVMQVLVSTSSTLDLQAFDFEGHSPLHCAVLSHNRLHHETQRNLKAHVKGSEELEMGKFKVMNCIMLLLQAGSCLSAQDIKSSKSVLHLAVQAGNCSLLRFFLEVNAGALPDFINMKAHGNTALHMAAALHGESQQEAIVSLLLAHGADPSLRNLDNEQPAHLLPPGAAGETIRGLLRRAKGMAPAVHPSSHRSTRQNQDR
ncbi:NF-kappa-B inhibitor delta-like isoform X1 [Anguilla rostrata]|uniref:NF-kappa-B inhibitor delta-like isoform X1 n=1 Tax=Anguilla rostrata TaxID=7938 RepID=UPI0030D2280D